MTGTAIDLETLKVRVGQVLDPEVPVLTIRDLGVLRSIDQDHDGTVVVTITPTYSGCPAMGHIESEILRVLDEHEIRGRVRTVYAPAWTTDWISAQGRRKLADYGIAPPRGSAAATETSEAVVAIRTDPKPLECPRCASTETELISEFGSTACKSLWRCRSCLEPFDHFKEL